MTIALGAAEIATRVFHTQFWIRNDRHSRRRQCCDHLLSGEQNPELPRPPQRRHGSARVRCLDRGHHRSHAEVRHGRLQARTHRRQCGDHAAGGSKSGGGGEEV